MSAGSEEWRPTASLETLQRRARMLCAARTFFAERDILEVETPVLTDDGVLLFSSNFRQFQLDAGGMTGLQHEDISRQTLPRARRRLASL